jgi:hypothetical protein
MKHLSLIALTIVGVLLGVAVLSVLNKPPKPEMKTVTAAFDRLMKHLEDKRPEPAQFDALLKNLTRQQSMPYRWQQSTPYRCRDPNTNFDYERPQPCATGDLTISGPPEIANEQAPNRSPTPAAKDQVSPSSSADPKTHEEEVQKDSCRNDWHQCKDNAQLVNNNSSFADILYDGPNYKCQRAANNMAQYGTPIWPSGWLSYPFGSFYPGTNYITSGRAILIEPDTQFQNMYGAMVHSRVECIYDLRAQRVINVDISPR